MTASTVSNALTLHPKVAGGTLSGAITVCILALLQQWNITVGDVTGSAITVIVAGLGGWLTPVASQLQTMLDAGNPAVVVPSVEPPAAV